MDSTGGRQGTGRGEERYADDVVRVYANERIEVVWEPAFCTHVGACFMGLPDVFDPWRRPWVLVDEGTPDEIAETILRCPTGALHFRRLDGGAQEPEPEPIEVGEQRNGPLYVRGRVRIEDEDGAVIREDTRMALCRCGQSGHKPFCDGTHRRVRFRTDRPSPRSA